MSKNTYIKKAAVSWKGEYAVNGSGFFIEIDNKTYKPENEEIIGEEFKLTQPVPALIEFKPLDKKIEYFRNDLPYKKIIDGIKILSIKMNM